MPPTIVPQQTWMCPEGIGKYDPVMGMPEGTCRAQGPEGSMCSKCGLALVRAIDPLDMATMTVMGAEDIEPEIAQTTVAQRFQRRADERAKRGRPPLTSAELAQAGSAELNAYRADRLLDIAHAIGEARKLEQKP